MHPEIAAHIARFPIHIQEKLNVLHEYTLKIAILDRE
jgi:hypothetical protein